MAAQHEPMRSQFPTPPSNSRPLRVNPFAPLPTSSPLSQQQVGPSAAWPEEVQVNNVPAAVPVTRTTSRKRRISGTGSDKRKSQAESYSQPPAPEVPRAPPVSYRGSDMNNAMNPAAGDPTSFSARARGFASGKETMPAEGFAEPKPTAQPASSNRRGSINRPSKAAKAQQAHERVETGFSQPPATSNGVLIQQSTSAKVPSQSEVPNKHSTQPGVNAIGSGLNENTGVIPVRSNIKRTSEKAIDPRKEWAPDRSPLQKLEVKLNDISKEEKRARVEKAERKLRERKAEEERQRNQSGQSATQERTSREIQGETTSQGIRNNSTGVSDAAPRHKETRSRNCAAAPAYVEDIDQQQLEKQQPHVDLLVSQNAAQKYQKASPTLVIPQKQAGRGVRFQNGHDVEDSNSPVSRDKQESVQVADPREVGTHSTRPQQRIRQLETSKGARHSKEVPSQQQALYSSKAQRSETSDNPADYGGTPDPVPKNSVRTHNHAVKYEVPPQTAAGIEARQKVGFGGDPAGSIAAPAQRQKHHLSRILHHGQRTVPPQTSSFETQPRHLDEWRNGGTARLTAASLINEPDVPAEKKAWWEGRSSGSQTKTSAPLSGRDIKQGSQDAYHADGYGHERKSFDPPLYLQCGPLLRYTGLKRDRFPNPRIENGTSTIERESWRGSVMIVTIDAESQYNPVPTLRLFPEPIDLLPPPPLEVNGDSGHSLPPEYVDPIAGLPKLTRTGTTVYVKPAEDLEQEADLSRVETDDGLFEETRTANVPTSYGMPKGAPQNAQVQSDRAKAQRRNKSAEARGQSVKGVRLHAERGVTFWRFNLEVELTTRQMRIGYSINNAPSIGFWVPARGQSMNVMFHSCNGFSMSVNPSLFSGPDPLWRDVLNSHQFRPFHVMIGGGDQIYNDTVMSQTKLFQEWLEMKNPIHKHEVPFSPEMQEELEQFYLERYSMWFSQGLFGMANSQIPMINIWDDHDIIDGFGSYPHHFMSTPVFCGLGAVAFKYYMLFQQQSVPDEGPADEPSWLLGAAPGPYINELSRNIFLSLGKHVAFLALDCRTERMREEVVSEATYDLVFDRCRRELIEGETKHLIVLLGVPIAYPRLVWLENLLTSKVMDPVKALGRAGMLTGFLNKFDGGVEILDDLDDHWTAKNHKRERNYFIQELQEVAAEKSVRVTILGGDVHLAAVGQFFSNPKLRIPKDRDHRYMANVISSAIVNTPPPEMMGDILNKRNKTHHLDHETDENMIPMFTHDVDGKPRNNKRLLPRRNWCSIREYQPGSTPPPTPSDLGTESPEGEPLQRPGVMQRKFSLTRADIKPGNLIRRLSQRDPQGSADYPPSREYRTSPTSTPSSPQVDGYFAPLPKRQSAMSSSKANENARFSSAPLPRPGNFHRRPTNMSFKAVKKGGAPEDDSEGHINLEHGLDIVLNCEVCQKDPAGITVPYRLLIPALLYEGRGDVNDAPYRRKSLLERFGSFRGDRRRSLAGNQGQGNRGKSQDSFNETESQSDLSERQLQQDAVGTGGALGRLRRSLSSRGKQSVPRDPQEGGEDGRVEGMGLFQRRPSVAKKDISAPQFQRDTVSAEAIPSPQQLAATARAAPNPQRQSQVPQSNTTGTLASSQIPQRQSSNTNRVEGMGIFPRRQSTTTRSHPIQDGLQSNPPNGQQAASQPLSLRMMEDRAEQQRQQSSNVERSDSGYPGRRPSKLDRLLGIGHAKDRSTEPKGQSYAARDAARREEEEYSTEGDYSDEDYSYEGSIGQDEDIGPEKQGGAPPPAKGYSGIGTYS